MWGPTTCIAAILAGAAPPEPVAAANDIYVCNFETENDVNFDGWPDRWTRRRGRGFPHYLPVGIEPEDGGNRCLRVELDGGGAVLYSPPLEIRPTYSFLLTARLRTQRLHHDVAFVGLAFLDADKKPIGEPVVSPRFREAPTWQTIRIGPLTPANPHVKYAVISLHVQPTENADLRGTVWFDDVRFSQLPLMTLRANSEHHLYTDPKAVEITCRVSGVSERSPRIQLEVLNEMGVAIDCEERPLPDGNGREGELVWQPTLPDYGFYQLRASLTGDARDAMQRTISLAVLPPLPAGLRGEFGWSLPHGDGPLTMKRLYGLLDQAAINWVKFPVWHGDDEPERADRLGWFADRLRSRGIELIGVLDQPPEKARALISEESRLPVASVFSTPKVWQQILNPVMTRQSLSIRWWQLGADDDTSFVGYPNVDAKIDEVRQYLRRFGQEVRLGLAWHWLHDTPRSPKTPWEFLSYTTDTQFSSEYVPPLTAEELALYLGRPKSGRRWLSLAPLPRGEYDVETRARDLVSRILAAKVKQADGIFHPDPFDPQIGLLNADATPGELLLPWRTTASLLSGATYVGSIQLPRGSRNYLFTRGSEAIMAVWNDRQSSRPTDRDRHTEESLYLGENVRQIDLWGRERPVRQTLVDRRPEQVLTVGPLPTFVTGLNLAVAQMRMSFQFDKQELASVFGKEQTATYRFRNFFEQGVGGKVSLQTPDVWEVQPTQSQFKLAADEERVETLRILLRPDASSGPQMIRADIEVTADRNYRFSVYRTLMVGLGDVQVEVQSRLDDEGRLIVEQKLTNRTEDFVSFNCLLFVPDRRRQRLQVVNLGHGQVSESFVIPDGRELIGKTLWLRCEEIGGARVLNHRFPATE